MRATARMIPLIRDLGPDPALEGHPSDTPDGEDERSAAEIEGIIMIWPASGFCWRH